jgi:hypothetical protein
VSNALNHSRPHNRPAEHFALVHGGCQPLGVRFDPELVPGAIAFHLRDTADLLSQLAEQLIAHTVFEHDEPLFVELTALFVRHD